MQRAALVNRSNKRSYRVSHMLRITSNVHTWVTLLPEHWRRSLAVCTSRANAERRIISVEPQQYDYIVYICKVYVHCWAVRTIETKRWIKLDLSDRTKSQDISIWRELSPANESNDYTCSLYVCQVYVHCWTVRAIETKHWVKLDLPDRTNSQDSLIWREPWLANESSDCACSLNTRKLCRT